MLAFASPVEAVPRRDVGQHLSSFGSRAREGAADGEQREAARLRTPQASPSWALKYHVLLRTGRLNCLQVGDCTGHEAHACHSSARGAMRPVGGWPETPAVLQ